MAPRRTTAAPGEPTAPHPVEDAQGDPLRSSADIELKRRLQPESSWPRPGSCRGRSRSQSRGDVVELSAAGSSRTRPGSHARNEQSAGGRPRQLPPPIQRRSTTIQSSATGRSRSIPGSFYNLDEVTLPDPIENPDERHVYRHHSLEEKTSRESRTRRDISTDVPPPPGGQDAEKGAEGGAWPNPQGLFASRAMTELSIISYLVFFSVLGTLSRLGLEALTMYPGAPIAFSTLWANFSGSLFLGFLAESSERLNGARKGSRRSSERHGPSSSGGSGGGSLRAGRAPPAEQMADDERQEGYIDDEAPAPRKPSLLYIGLSTGFCGSLTTFSSFARDVFISLSNGRVTPPPPSRTIGDDVMAALAVTATTLFMCLAAVKAGAQIAILVGRADWVLPGRVHAFLNRAVLVIGVGTWAGAITMAALPPDRPSGPRSQGAPWEGETWRGLVLFALVLAPTGCLARFYLSIGLNGLRPGFPVGTFAANTAGTLLLGIAWDLQHSSRGNSRVSCQVLQGVMDGLCGCLTTVSTWVAELGSLRRRHAYAYGTATLGTSLALLVVVMGSQKWSTGWIAPTCSVVG